jgi:hypothetical protein
MVGCRWRLAKRIGRERVELPARQGCCGTTRPKGWAPLLNGRGGPSRPTRADERLPGSRF